MNQGFSRPSEHLTISLMLRDTSWRCTPTTNHMKAEDPLVESGAVIVIQDTGRLAALDPSCSSFEKERSTLWEWCQNQTPTKRRATVEHTRLTMVDQESYYMQHEKQWRNDDLEHLEKLVGYIPAIKIHRTTGSVLDRLGTTGLGRLPLFAPEVTIRWWLPLRMLQPKTRPADLASFFKRSRWPLPHSSRYERASTSDRQ